MTAAENAMSNAPATNFCFVMPPGEPYGASGGAIATVTRGVVRELSLLGYLSDVVTPGPGPFYEATSVRRGLGHPRLLRALGKSVRPLASVLGWDWPGYGGYLASTLPLILAHKRQIVIVHNDLHLPLLLRKLAPRTKTVLWLHNEVESHHTQLQAALAAPHRIIAVSESVLGWTLHRFDLSPERVVVVHNGVDLDAFRPSPAIDERSGLVRVVCHGRLDPNKGFDLVAQAVRSLRAEGFDVTLTLAGPKQAWGISRHDASAYYKYLLGLLEGGTGHYLGRVDPHELPALLAQHHIACAISRSQEPFGLSPLEAMAAGCATVVSDRGGLPELAGEGCTIVAPQPEAVLTALRALLANPAQLSLARASARRRAEELPWHRTAVGLLEALNCKGSC